MARRSEYPTPLARQAVSQVRPSTRAQSTPREPNARQIPSPYSIHIPAFEIDRSGRSAAPTQGVIGHTRCEPNEPSRSANSPGSVAACPARVYGVHSQLVTTFLSPFQAKSEPLSPKFKLPSQRTPPVPLGFVPWFTVLHYCSLWSSAIAVWKSLQ